MHPAWVDEGDEPTKIAHPTGSTRLAACLMVTATPIASVMQLDVHSRRAGLQTLGYLAETLL